MTVADQAASLREDFAFLDEWEARFTHLIDLGKSLPPLKPEEYSEANKVRGCSSQVWLVAEPSPENPGAICFRGGSDAMIVAGLGLGVFITIRIAEQRRLDRDETLD